MTPERAWQSALAQLQLDLPRYIYTNWIQDTQLLSCEASNFVFKVPSALHQAWLTERLTSTLTRLLSGGVGGPVRVQFIVNAPAEPAEGAAGKIEAEDPSAVAVPAEDTALAECAAAAVEAEPADLQVQPVHASLYDVIVHPERVVVVPGYFRRWLPYLGPNLAWIVVAFRQAMYLSTGQAARPGVSFTVSPAAVASWAGIDRTTLWRRLADRRLSWFIERSPAGNSSYRFVAGMPLTPGDAFHLQNFLLENCARLDPLAALERACAADLDQLLSGPFIRPAPEQLEVQPQPGNVSEVVLKACGKVSGAVQQRVLELAARLEERLQPPQDLLVISHYFLHHLLPVLGAGPAWLVTLLRDRCFASGSERRDTVWVGGGYTELAARLGLSRPKTVAEWLQPEGEAGAEPGTGSTGERQSGGKPVQLAQFLERIGSRGGNGAVAWLFKVNLLEPLLPDHKKEYDRALAWAGAYEQESEARGEDPEVVELPCRWQGDLATGVSESAAGLGGPATDPGGSATGKEPVVTRLQPVGGAVATGAGRGCNALNSLKLLNPALEKSSSPTPPTRIPGIGSSSQLPVTGGVGGWVLADLLARSPAIPPGSRRALLAKRASPQAFVSWLLYAASPAGQGVKTPAQLAANRLLAEPVRGAGGAFDRLAGLPPEQLRLLIETAQSPYRAMPSTEWITAMGKRSDPAMLQRIKGDLFGA